MWNSVKATTKQIGAFIKEMTPLTAAIVAGGLGYLLGAKSNIRIK